jgi:hypothetical protein
MASRWWGLNRRQTAIALVVAVVIGVVGALLISGGGGSDQSRPNLQVNGIAAGTKGSPHAVWVFGFRTLRFDPDLGALQQVNVTAFGSVVGQDGRVDMYDIGTGGVGVLRSARNTVELLGTIHGGSNPPSLFTNALAATDGALWLAPNPGEVTRFDLASGRAGPPIALATGGNPPGSTSLVAAKRVVVSASDDDTGITLHRIDPATSAVAAVGRIELPSPALAGLATDGTHVWVVANDTIYDLDAATLSVIRTVTVGPRDRAVRGAVVADGALWMLARNGGALARLAPDASSVTIPVRLLPAVPKQFRTPASLVTDGTRIYAMVQTSNRDGNHQVRLVEHRIDGAAQPTGVEIPSSVFAGAAVAT